LALDKNLGRMKTIIIGMDKCSVKKNSFSDVYQHAQVLSKKIFLRCISDNWHRQQQISRTHSHQSKGGGEEGTQEETKEGKMGPF